MYVPLLYFLFDAGETLDDFSSRGGKGDLAFCTLHSLLECRIIFKGDKLLPRCFEFGFATQQQDDINKILNKRQTVFIIKVWAGEWSDLVLAGEGASPPRWWGCAGSGNPRQTSPRQGAAARAPPRCASCPWRQSWSWWPAAGVQAQPPSKRDDDEQCK